MNKLLSPLLYVRRWFGVNVVENFMVIKQLKLSVLLSTDKIKLSVVIVENSAFYRNGTESVFGVCTKLRRVKFENCNMTGKIESHLIPSTDD